MAAEDILNTHLFISLYFIFKIKYIIYFQRMLQCVLGNKITENDADIGKSYQE